MKELISWETNLIHGRAAKISKEHPSNMMILLEAFQENGEWVPRNAYWYMDHTFRASYCMDYMPGSTIAEGI